MRLGIITDVHNNVVALQRVVEELNKAECDYIICCGDIIGIGPCPEETVRCMMRIPNLIAVKGNHDSYLDEDMMGRDNMAMGEIMHHRWEHQMLSEESIRFLRSLPYQRDIDVEGYRISILHYAMDEKGHFANLVKNPSKEDIHAIFANVDSDIVLYGHEHTRNILLGDKSFVNVGSLGCPSHGGSIARAGILKIEEGRISIEAIDLEYDVKEVLRQIDAINYPEANNIKRFFYGV